MTTPTLAVPAKPRPAAGPGTEERDRRERDDGDQRQEKGVLHDARAALALGLWATSWVVMAHQIPPREIASLDHRQRRQGPR